MAGGLLFRLFGAGRMPVDVRREIAAETVLFEAQGIRVVLHRRGRVPGSVAAGPAANFGLGSFAVTDRRVVGSRGRAKWVDVPYDAAAPGPGVLTLDEHGLHVVFDLDRVHPSCQGEMRIEFHAEIAESELARFPSLSVPFEVDPQKVVRLFGSLKKLPPDPSAAPGGQAPSDL